MHIPLIYIIIYLCFCAWLLKIKIKIKNLFLGEGEGGKYHIFLMNGHWPMQYVKLNLINHFVSFILCQFACNSAFRNLVFMWESRKVSVWESVKKSSRVCTRGWQVTQGGTYVERARELKSHASWSTTWQNFQSGQVVSSRLRLTTQSNHPVCYKPDLSHSKHTPV